MRHCIDMDLVSKEAWCLTSTVAIRLIGGGGGVYVGVGNLDSYIAKTTSHNGCNNTFSSKVYI